MTLWQVETVKLKVVLTALGGVVTVGLVGAEMRK